MRRPSVTTMIALAAASALLAGCGASTKATSTDTTASGATASGQITVLAAASLTGSFTILGKQYEAAHPGTKIVFSFGASSTLAAQITQGAPADVFASASKKNMDQVISAKEAATSTTFAKNTMEIAVPPANPAKITALADLAKPGVKVALCAPAVPCGAVAHQVFTNAKITVKPATEEVDVKSTLTKVELGEVDAGVVYVTDVLAAGTKVQGVTIPAEVNASTSYPIATLTGSKNATLATAFVDYVLSAEGATALTAAGFLKP